MWWQKRIELGCKIEMLNHIKKKLKYQDKEQRPPNKCILIKIIIYQIKQQLVEEDKIKIKKHKKVFICLFFFLICNEILRKKRARRNP